MGYKTKGLTRNLQQVTLETLAFYEIGKLYCYCIA